MIYQGTTPKTLDNFPQGVEVMFHTDADVTIAFFYPLKNDWGPEIAISSPGDFLGCGGNIGRITGTANVRIF